MQSHLDSDADGFMRRLRQRADDAMKAKASTITGGEEGESPLAQWMAHGVSVKHLPPDEQGILRISVGGGSGTPVPLNYLVFRGEHARCIHLLRRALHALEAGPR